MNKTINNITFTALTIIVLLASSARAQTCHELHNNVQEALDQQGQLKSKDGKDSLMSLQKEYDSAKAKEVVLRSLSNLSKKYQEHINQMRNGDYTKILSKDAKEILEEVDDRFTVAAKYTIMANAIIGGRRNSKSGEKTHEHALDYLKAYKDSGEPGTFYGYLASCDERLGLSKKERDYYFNQNTEEELVKSGTAFMKERKEFDQILRCRRIQNVVTDLKGRTEIAIPVQVFFENYANLLSITDQKIPALDATSEGHFYNNHNENLLNKARDGGDFSYFNIFKSQSERINNLYKGKVDPAKLNTLSNNYKLLTDTYKKTTEYVQDNMLTLSGKDKEKVDLKNIGQALDRLKCGDSKECSPIGHKATADLVKTINQTSKALGKDLRVSEDNVFSMGDISRDYLKSIIPEGLAQVKEKGIESMTQDELKDLFKDVLKEQSGSDPKLCPEDIFKKSSWEKLSSCLRHLHDQGIENKVSAYETKAAQALGKIKDVYKRNKEKYSQLEKMKIYSLGKYAKSCSDQLSQDDPITSIKSDCGQLSHSTETTSLEKTIKDIKKISEVALYSKQTNLDDFDPSTSKSLTGLSNEFCKTKSEFTGVCEGLKTDIKNIALKEEIEQKRAKRRLEQDKLTQFQDRKYYLQYNRATGKMSKKKRPRYAVFNHALKYGAAQFSSIMGPLVNTQRFRGSLFSMQTSAIFMKQQLHWQKQSMQRYYDLSNPYLTNGFYTGTTSPGFNFTQQ